MLIRVPSRRWIERSPKPLGEREHVIAEIARSVYDHTPSERVGR
jgi:hypothetical protein